MYWKDAKGNVTEIKNMTTSHLQSCIKTMSKMNFTKKNVQQEMKIYEALLIELNKRKLPSGRVG